MNSASLAKQALSLLRIVSFSNGEVFQTLERLGLRNFHQVNTVCQGTSCKKLSRIQPFCEIVYRQLHTSTTLGKKKKNLPKQQEIITDQRQSPISKEMRSATEAVAKSLGDGENWKATADELLARLISHQEPPKDKTKVPEGQEVQSSPLLTTMKKDGRGGDFKARKPVKLPMLFKGTRLGIFDAKAVRDAKKLPQPEVKHNLWHQVEQERLALQLGPAPQSAFQDWAIKTKQGTAWKFPINNEEDMHEERKVKFYEHIFLEQHLGEFPDQGPIRKFMELVCIGLGRNPWMSAALKREHIQWYAKYFREKEELLVATIGEQGKMKDKKTVDV